MKVIALTRSHFGRHFDLLTETFRLRRHVFKERLDWEVSVTDGLEIDVYDAFDPTHLVLTINGYDAVGCVRLLPTTGPTMLANTFAMLLSGLEPPCNVSIIESSRFCVDTKRLTELAENGLRRATFVLFAGMIEQARAIGAQRIVTVTDTRMERVLRRAGWPLERIAPPIQIGDTMALAGFLEVSDDALAAIYRAGELSGPILTVPEMPRRAA
jgi:acyl homoserine lactone synthase